MGGKQRAARYPSPKGTAVLSGALKVDPFGDGTIVDHVTITGHPTATVWTFAGREVAVLPGGGARGTWRYTGSTPAGSTITGGRSAGTIIYGRGARARARREGGAVFGILRGRCRDLER